MKNCGVSKLICGMCQDKIGKFSITGGDESVTFVCTLTEMKINRTELVSLMAASEEKFSKKKWRNSQSSCRELNAAEKVL